MNQLYCDDLGVIYYAEVNDKGEVQRIIEEITFEAIEAVIKHMAIKASDTERFNCKFNGKCDIEMDGFVLSFDGTGNKQFMDKHSVKE